MEKPTHRLLSLDILRGADLFLLVALQPILWGLLPLWQGNPVADALLFQLDHEVWEGFRAWDLVMPLFLFMSGAALPFSVAKYLRDGNRRGFVLRLVRRFVVLFLLGMVVQGNLLAWSWESLCPYANTLQAIASGYLIAGIAVLWCDAKRLWAVVAALLVLYWIPMAIGGDYSPEGNFASTIDRFVLGNHRGDATYTWIWSSLNFGATVLLGTIAGTLLRREGDKSAHAFRLAAIGAALVVGGLLLSPWHPIIKRLWTSSMTLFSGGLCMLLLAACYYAVDCRGWHRGLMWLRYYGCNAITAYMLGEWLNFRGIVHQFTFGLERFTGDYYGVLLTAGHALVVFLLLRLLFRCKIFLKI